MFMVDLEELNKEKENRLRESLKRVDAEAEYVKKTPNEIWSKQQADFLSSYVDAQNKLWREKRKMDPNYIPF